MFTPAITQSGLGGWTLLKATYDRQLETYSSNSQVNADATYLKERLASPMSLESFLDDRRLLRISLTAFGLEGEEWKRGFIEKVLQESTLPQSPFLSRLRNPDYIAFAEAFSPQDGQINLSETQTEAIRDDFEAASFRLAVGEVDNDMRLALNYEARIGDLAQSTSTDEAIVFKLLGNVPMRTVLETALNLPSDLNKLNIEKQSEILRDRVATTLGVRQLSDLAETGVVERVIERFHAMQAISNGSQDFTPASVALTLLGGGNGLGATASQNLFMSQIAIV